MKAGVLFSGGKDSSLAAIMLSRDYEIELNTFVFDPSCTLPGVEEAAGTLGFPWRIRVFEEGILDEVVNLVIKCGYPNTAITELHRRAVQILCGEYAVTADGTRLNDRVPMLSRDDVQSFSIRTAVHISGLSLDSEKPRPNGLQGATSRSAAVRQESSITGIMSAGSGQRCSRKDWISRNISRNIMNNRLLSKDYIRTIR